VVFEKVSEGLLEREVLKGFRKEKFLKVFGEEVSKGFLQ